MRLPFRPWLAALSPSQAAPDFGRNSLFLPAILAIFIAFIFSVASEATPTWLILIFMGICAAASMFWFGDVKRLMMFMFVFTTPIDISKALIIPGGVYSPGLSLYLSDLFLLGLIFTWLLEHCLIRHEKFRVESLDKVAAVFIAWLWISAFYSPDVFAGALAAVTYTKFFISYYVLTQVIRTPDDLRKVLLAFFVGFALQSLYVAAQVASGSPLELQGAKTTYLGTQLVFSGGEGVNAFRPSGFLHHPNVLADYLVFLLPTAAAIFLVGKKATGRTIWFAVAYVLLIGSGMLIITLSRGGWISAGVAGLFMIIVGLRQGLVTRQHIAILVATTVLGLAAVGVVYPAAYLRITQGDQRSTESRVVMIDQALLIIRNNPLLGVGFGGYNNAAQYMIPESFSYVSTYFQDEIKKGVVHNKYLLTTAEHGAIGMFLFLYLIWRFFRQLFPLSKWKSKLYFALALGLSASILGQLSFYVFDHFYADVRIALLWVLFGIYHALLRVNAAATPAVQARKPLRMRPAR